MNEVTMLITYKLKKGVSKEDFIKITEKLNKEYMSKQKGYISWKQLIDDKTWADWIIWESLEDAQRVLHSEEENEIANKFYSFINLSVCRTNLFQLEKEY